MKNMIDKIRNMPCGTNYSAKAVVSLAVAKLLIVGFLFYTSAGCAHCMKDKDTISQVSTIDALLNTCYDGSVSIGELKKRGDTGIGTFDRVDGEMIALDGVFYRIKSDGTIAVADDADTSPFCAVTFFDKDKTVELKQGLKFNQLSPALLDGSPNYFYAIRIEGKFKSVKARSVPKQSKPYPMLLEVSKTQPVFNYADVEGTAVGFFCPQYVKGINVPGYHLHFISADRKTGGHILDFEIDRAVMRLDESRGFSMMLPDDDTFKSLDLTKDREKELNKVEK